MNKKTYLIILYSVTILVILSVVAIKFSKWGSSILNNFGVWSLSTSADTTTETWDVSEFDSINADLTVASVELVYGSKNTVEFTGTSNIVPEVTVSDKVLYIKQPGKTNLFGNNNGKIKITVNKKEFDNFVLNSDVGEVNINDTNFSFTSLSFKTDVGEVLLKNVTVAGNTEITTNVGEVEIKNCSLNNTTITTDVGEVSIRDTFASTNSFDLHNDVGGITCFDNKGKDHSYKCSGSGATVNITTDVGEISIK